MSASQERRIILPYTPRPLQRQLHQSLEQYRWSVFVIHRRFGKTVMLLNHLIKQSLLSDKQNPRYAYVAPFLKQAKTVAWDYLKYYSDPIPGRLYNETELRVDLPNGARIRLFGADNADSLRGMYLDGAVLDEYGSMDPRVFTGVIRPALSDRLGWCCFSGTPNGRNHLYDILNRAKDETSNEGWFQTVLKASQTGVLSQAELEDAKRVMSAEEYEREFECSFDNAIIGCYYGSLMNDAVRDGRVGYVPYDPMLPVTTAWDLGVGDATAIWFFQVYGNSIRVIDYFEASGEGLNFYAKELDKKPYKYDQHIMPHDIRVREMGTGKSRYETALGLGIKPITIAKQLPVDDGIQAVRMILPKCYFDKVKCAQGIAGLQDYRKEYDEMRKEYKNRPVHDWTSHPSDAFRMFAVGFQEPTKKKSVSEVMRNIAYRGVW